MGKKLILAVAGSGKTYSICNSLDPNARNLILAFTHRNIDNIIHELVQAHGTIPHQTEVMTFDSFLYQIALRPYESIILSHFGENNRRIKGITFRKPPANSIYIKDKGYRPNPQYSPVDTYGHYFTDDLYYCEYLSKLIIRTNCTKTPLVEKITHYINMFFDCVYFDEFQDYREYDFELIELLFRKLNNVYGYGDYYQHSVSGTNNSGKPYKLGKKDVSIEEFIETIRSWGVEVDTSVLCKTRRCPQNVCTLINNKLKICIEANNKHTGCIRLARSEDIAHSVLSNNNIKKLVYREASKYNMNCINWGYSKGDTYSAACVILTEAFDELFNKSFSLQGIAPTTVNELYVAITRTSGDLWFIKKGLFDSVKDAFI